MCGPRRSSITRASAQPRDHVGAAHAVARAHGPAVGGGLLLLLAMAIPFVHMVAFCGDLGFCRSAQFRGGVADPADRRRLDLPPWDGWPTISDRSRSACSAQSSRSPSLLGFVFVEKAFRASTPCPVIHGIPYIAIVRAMRSSCAISTDRPSPAGAWAWSCCSPWPAWRSAAGWAAPSSTPRCPTAAAFQAALAFNLLNLMLLGALLFTRRRRIFAWEPMNNDL